MKQEHDVPPVFGPGRSWLNGFWICVAGSIALFAILAAARRTFTNSDAMSPLRAPGFENVSAFGESETALIEAWLQEQATLANYPSLSVAIIRNGKVVFSRALGFENVEEERNAGPTTTYNVASVTKVFTASLAAILHARGVIDLDRPVIQYLPKEVKISSDPKVGATITMRQLASHTSGLPRGVPGEVQSVEGRYELEPERLYKHLADVRMDSMPGTREEYSNLGFGLLGHALERAAGKPFDHLLQELICDPLQMKRTGIDVGDETLAAATGYNSSSARRTETTHSYRERLAASGGLVASVEDLAKFMAAQMDPGVFSRETLELLLTPTKLSDGSSTRHSLGWRVETKSVIGPIYRKNGGRNNCTAWIGFAPDHKLGVAVVSNCGGPDVDEIGQWLLSRSVPSAKKPPVTR